MNVLRREASRIAITVIFLALLALIFFGTHYFSRAAKVSTVSRSPEEAKAYLASLELSGVEMKAAENLMAQQVVYVDGTIRNKGSRSIRRIDVYCLFTDVNGREVARKRAVVVNERFKILAPSQSRRFELPFDSLPDTWNQTMPRLVIAQIIFE